jgi:hypothetical protein
MNVIRKTLKPMSITLAVIMFLICAPVHSVFAAMIGTETVLDSARVLETRKMLNQFLARQDVQDALITRGIDPMEAKARIDSLSDDEVVSIAGKIDQLPAGGGFIEVLLIVALIVFIVLVVTDLTGVTDVFPFIKAQ